MLLAEGEGQAVLCAVSGLNMVDVLTLVASLAKRSWRPSNSFSLDSTLSRSCLVGENSKNSK